MLNKTQFSELERRLWAECSHGAAYEALKEAMQARDRLEELIGATYAVLADNRRHLRNTYKLEKLETMLTLIEEELT